MIFVACVGASYAYLRFSFASGQVRQTQAASSQTESALQPPRVEAAVASEIRSTVLIRFHCSENSSNHMSIRGTITNLGPDVIPQYTINVGTMFGNNHQGGMRFRSGGMYPGDSVELGLGQRRDFYIGSVNLYPPLLECGIKSVYANQQQIGFESASDGQ